jgi:hypothetical protein
MFAQPKFLIIMKMKHLMTAAAGCIILFVATSCSKKDTNPSSTSTTGSTTGATTGSTSGSGCFLTKQDEGADYFTIAYNGNNTPSQIILYDSAGNLTVNYMLIYSGPGGALSRVDLKDKNNALITYRIFNYNPGGTVGSVIHFGQSGSGSGMLTKTDSVSYGYNSSGQIDKESLYHDKGNGLALVTNYTFQYDANGNNIKMLGYSPSTGSTPIVTWEWTYDSKKAPQGLQFMQYMEIGHMATNNNALTYSQKDGIGTSVSSTYIYTYNAQGYPVTIKSTTVINSGTFYKYYTETYNCK